MFHFRWSLVKLACLSPFAAQWETQNHVPLWPDFSSWYLLLTQTKANIDQKQVIF